LSFSRRLVLFDIDGTLLSAGGVSRRALEVALRDCFDYASGFDGYDFSGKTDPQIVRELLAAAGHANDGIEAGLADCLGVYHANLARELGPADVKAKPGVHALLDDLSRSSDVTLALLTGNLEPCARLKLGPLDLNRYFAFGAYGSDHAERARLPPVAVTRAKAVTGLEFVGKQVVIVGDSIHDVRCGQGIGVRALAVATGLTSAEQLAAEAPDALLPDFRDTAAAARAILG